MKSTLPFMLDVVVLVLFFTFMLTQVILPLWQGRKLFPWFRRDRRALRRKITETIEELDKAKTEREIARAEKLLRPGEPAPKPSTTKRKRS